MTRWIPPDRTLPLLPDGGFLRAHRLAKGWTQVQLADASGLTPKYIGELERGVKKGGPVGWKRIADALDISVLELIPTMKVG